MQIETEVSKKEAVACGVPQGSIPWSAIILIVY